VVRGHLTRRGVQCHPDPVRVDGGRRDAAGGTDGARDSRVVSVESSARGSGKLQ
jgi:hypothetical protein